MLPRAHISSRAVYIFRQLQGVPCAVVREFLDISSVHYLYVSTFLASSWRLSFRALRISMVSIVGLLLRPPSTLQYRLSTSWRIQIVGSNKMENKSLGCLSSSLLTDRKLYTHVECTHDDWMRKTFSSSGSCLQMCIAILCIPLTFLLNNHCSFCMFCWTLPSVHVLGWSSPDGQPHFARIWTDIYNILSETGAKDLDPPALFIKRLSADNISIMSSVIPTFSC